MIPIGLTPYQSRILKNVERIVGAVFRKVTRCKSILSIRGQRHVLLWSNRKCRDLQIKILEISPKLDSYIFAEGLDTRTRRWSNRAARFIRVPEQPETNDFKGTNFVIPIREQ